MTGLLRRNHDSSARRNAAQTTDIAETFTFSSTDVRRTFSPNLDCIQVTEDMDVQATHSDNGGCKFAQFHRSTTLAGSDRMKDGRTDPSESVRLPVRSGSCHGSHAASGSCQSDFLRTLCAAGSVGVSEGRLKVAGERRHRSANR